MIGLFTMHIAGKATQGLRVFTWTKALDKNPYILPLALILAFWPVWRWYVLRMTDGSDEPWGIAALSVAGWFLWQARKEIRMTSGGLWVAGGFLGVYLLSYSVLPPLLRAGLALLCLAALTGTLTRCPTVWGLFALSLPIIASMQFYLGPPLRLLTATMAQGTLTVAGLEVTRQGTELVWNGQTVGVDAPCSGIKMLWTGLLLILSLAALHRLNWPRTILAVISGIVLIVLGNALRATLLFTKEAGIVTLPDWTHEGIGLAVFAALVFGLSWWFGRLRPQQHPDSPPTWLTDTSRAPMISLLVLTCAAALTPFVVTSGTAQVSDADFPGWPVQWRDHWLEPLPLTEQEAAFAAKFPGKVGVFAAGPNKIIVRWVTQPTRKLHSSSDCLRASGYRIDTERPGAFVAKGPQGSFLVEEEIYEHGLLGDESWKEVSFWYWSAFFAKTTGPWWAVTAIQPLDQ